MQPSRKSLNLEDIKRICLDLSVNRTEIERELVSSCSSNSNRGEEDGVKMRVSRYELRQSIQACKKLQLTFTDVGLLMNWINSDPNGLLDMGKLWKWVSVVVRTGESPGSMSQIEHMGDVGSGPLIRRLDGQLRKSGTPLPSTAAHASA
eukprot:2397821-Pyramimonas_sp.AAC.1